MKNILIIIILFFISGCNIASKKALIETRKDLSELAKAHQKLAESHEVLTDVTIFYAKVPEPVASAIKQDAQNRVTEAKTIEIKITENSKKEVGFFSKQSFGYMLTAFWDVAKPFIDKTVKAVVEVASNQSGIIGIVGGIVATAYGVYTQISKNNVVAKVVADKYEAKEIEHEADKLIPAEQHATWEKAEKEAKVVVYSKRKGFI